MHPKYSPADLLILDAHCINVAVDFTVFLGGDYPHFSGTNLRLGCLMRNVGGHVTSFFHIVDLKSPFKQFNVEVNRISMRSIPHQNPSYEHTLTAWNSIPKLKLHSLFIVLC